MNKTTGFLSLIGIILIALFPISCKHSVNSELEKTGFTRISDGSDLKSNVQDFRSKFQEIPEIASMDDEELSEVIRKIVAHTINIKKCTVKYQNGATWQMNDTNSATLFSIANDKNGSPIIGVTNAHVFGAETPLESLLTGECSFKIFSFDQSEKLTDTEKTLEFEVYVSDKGVQEDFALVMFKDFSEESSRIQVMYSWASQELNAFEQSQGLPL